jgi:hypothetical protein
MSVEQTDKVDFIGVDDATGDVALGISDHLEWADEDHLRILQDKINAYLRFVESGEILESYPDARGRHVTIELIARCEPDQKATRFLDRVRKTLEGAGLGFRLAQGEP